MASLIDSKGFRAPLAMLPGLSSFVTRQSLLSLSLTVAKRSVEQLPFGAIGPSCNMSQSVLHFQVFFLATEFLFMATILER